MHVSSSLGRLRSCRGLGLPWALRRYRTGSSAAGWVTCFFYAQTSVTMCIQAGGPIRELTPLVMGDCRGPAAAFVVDTREKKIRFHASPRFCIGFTNDGLAQVLQCDGTEQEYGYDRRTETIRFAPIPERLLIVWE